MFSLLGNVASSLLPQVVDWGKEKLSGWLNPSSGKPKQLGDFGGVLNTLGSLARRTGNDLYKNASQQVSKIGQSIGRGQFRQAYNQIREAPGQFIKKGKQLISQRSQQVISKINRTRKRRNYERESNDVMPEMTAEPPQDENSEDVYVTPDQYFNQDQQDMMNIEY